MQNLPSSEIPQQGVLLPYHVTEVYDQFRIPENLRRHMLWVASIGTILSEAALERGHFVNQQLTLGALLLHDLGNIIKYDFSRPELLSPQDQERILELQEQQNHLRQQYGDDPEKTTSIFAASIGAPQSVITLIQSMHLRNLSQIVNTGTLEEKIATYADLRVSPHGIVSLHERIADAQVRYPHLQKIILEQIPLCDELETQLATLLAYNPAEISPETVANRVPNVRSFDLYSLR